MGHVKGKYVGHARGVHALCGLSLPPPHPDSKIMTGWKGEVSM